MSEPNDVKPDTWLVYHHTCEQSQKSYIGITKKSLKKRWQEHVSLSNDKRLSVQNKKYRFQRAIKKYGVDAWQHEVLAEGLDFEVACELEKSLIAELKTLSPNGYNETEGGKCVTLTLEGKERHRQATYEALHKPDVRERYLVGIRRSHSTPEFLENNKKAQKIAQNRPDVIELKSLKMKEHCAQSSYISPRAKFIEQLDFETGNILNSYESVTKASKATKINLGHISEVARGARKRAGGFGWRYVEERSE